MDRLPFLPGLGALGRIPALIPASRQIVRRHDEARSRVDRIRIGPSEAYAVWARCCGDKFLYDYLLGAKAAPAERRCVRRRVLNTMRLHGKKKFTAKLTGPGRIGFLSSIFSEPRFVNVVRDPRAIVDSLLRVPFWRKTFRYSEPAWKGGLTTEDISDWKRSGTAEALAAVQCRAVLRTTREEAASAPEQYIETRYEDFVARPHEELSRLFGFADLKDDAAAHAFVDELGVRDLTAGWQKRLSPFQIETIETITGSLLNDLGYEAYSQ